MSDDDRMDRIEGMIGTLVTTITQVHNDVLEIARRVDGLAHMVGELARTNAAEHAEYRQDIARLYRAFSDHYRDAHGGPAPDAR